MRTLIAFVQAILTFVGFGILAFVILAQAAPPINYILSIFVFIGAFISSRSVFYMTIRRGVMNVLASNSASPAADDLQALEGNGISKTYPCNLSKEFSTQLEKLGACTISIWGDGEGRKLKEKNKLIKVRYIHEKNLLNFQFEGNKSLIIRNASEILFCDTYIKIREASEVLWKYKLASDQYNEFNYLFSKNEIKTKSNTRWKPHKYDLGPGMNAIYLQGFFNLKGKN